jgi:hypothetical protein
MARIIVIAWKWTEIDVFAHYPLAIPDVQDCIIQVKQEIIPKQIVNIISTFFENLEEHEFVILCHSHLWGEERKRELVNLMPSQSKVLVHTFSGGQAFVYYNKKSDTGLIDQTGQFIDTYQYDEETKQSWIPEIFIDGRINPYYFDPVWVHYYYGIKPKINALRNDLARHLYLQEGRVFALPEVVLNKINELKILLNHLNNTDISIKFENLMDGIQQTSTLDMKDFDKQFSAIMDLVPGSTTT